MRIYNKSSLHNVIAATALSVTMLLSCSPAAVAYPEHTGNARVVPLPFLHGTSSNKADSTHINPAKNVKNNTGSAEPSIYGVPELSKTALKSASDIWVLGVLGGNREKLSGIASLFDNNNKPNNQDLNRFIALREAAYPFTTWGISESEGIKEITISKKNGTTAYIFQPDTDSIITKIQSQILKDYPSISEPSARVIAEWQAAAKLGNRNFISKMNIIRVGRQIPIGINGKVTIVKTVIYNMCNAPEKYIAEALRDIKNYKLNGLEPAVENIKEIVEFTTTTTFSEELILALSNI